MKKVWKLVLVSGIALLVLAACKPKEEVESQESSTSESETALTTETSGSTVASEVVFRGKLSANATEFENGVSLPLMETKAVVDPEDVVAGIGAEGVILNAETSQLPDDFKVEDYVTGVEVEVTLVENPVMARSMPPQIPGGSIISIKKIAE